jgi:hypothetical protein
MTRAQFAFSMVVCAMLTAPLACGSDAPPPADGGIEVSRDQVGDVLPIDSGTTLINGTAIRRMTLAELDKSVTVAAGTAADGSPIYWQAKAGVAIPALNDRAYGPVLGIPDYVSITSEDPSPSPLYVKFVQDLSRDVCAQMVTADTNRPPEQDLVLWRHAPVDTTASEAQIDQNLGYLLLRFLGLENDEATSRIDALRSLYQVAKSQAETNVPSAPQQVAWGVVCIALFEDPAFHLH